MDWNRPGSSVERLMDIEAVIPSKVSPKEKNKYHVLMHMCGIQKNSIDDLICKPEIETHLENKCMNCDGVG